MSIEELAPELVVQIFSSLHSISDVLNLARTCKHLHALFRSTRRLPTLFAAAEREFGPVDEIVRLVTFNGSQYIPGSTDGQATTVAQNAELLKQILRIGRTAQRIEELYPARKWGDVRYLERRSLTYDEAWRLRRAVYRYWLYCEAFQNKMCPRTSRSLTGLVEERSRLLRGWTSDELFEIEDVRLVLEDIISTDLCPTDGMAHRWFNEHCDFSDVRWRQQSINLQQHTPFHANSHWNSWPPDRHSPYAPTHLFPSAAFHSHRDQLRAQARLDIPVHQRRKTEMRGWGDDINQYYVVQSMLKLNPAQIIYLYENVTLREGIEWYIESEIGAEWFWDNGQTWIDTWGIVLMRRGWDLGEVEAALDNGTAGIVGVGLGEAGLCAGMSLDCAFTDMDGDDGVVCFQ